MSDPREVSESPRVQGVSERIAYVFDWTADTAKGTLTAATVKLYQWDGTDKSSTLLSGTTTVNGYLVTTPLVISLVSGMKYKLSCLATIGGIVLEAILLIDAKA